MYIAEGNAVLLETRLGERRIAECCDPVEARFYAAVRTAFSGVGDTTAAALLDSGAVASMAKAFEKELIAAARRIAETAAADAAYEAAAARHALAAE